MVNKYQIKTVHSFLDVPWKWKVLLWGEGNWSYEWLCPYLCKSLHDDQTGRLHMQSIADQQTSVGQNIPTLAVGNNRQKICVQFVMQSFRCIDMLCFCKLSLPKLLEYLKACMSWHHLWSPSIYTVLMVSKHCHILCLQVHDLWSLFCLDPWTKENSFPQ